MSNVNTVVRVDFQKRTRLLSIGNGLYQISGRDGFYARPVCKGRQREIKLKSRTETAARKELGKWLFLIGQYESGLGPDPFTDRTALTVLSLCDFYIEQGCPKRRGQARAGDTFDAERRLVETLKKWPGAKRPAKELSLEACRAYRDWRVKHVTRGKGGDRAVDIELATLSNIFRCAQRHSSITGIDTNPIAHDRPRFRQSANVTHCRDHMPRSGNELHALARYHFECGAPAGKKVNNAEVFGWLILLTAICGHRIGAMLKLRIDAASKTDPGFIAGRRLYLFRSQTHKGTCGHVDLTESEQACLQAFLDWHQRRYPNSPWFFPGKSSDRPLDDSALTHRLPEICQALGLGHITAHGLRAFRVNVLRSRGLADDKVADLIGHKSRGRLIVDVYGEGLDYKLEFMPSEGSPAWAFNEPHRAEQLQLL